MSISYFQDWLAKKSIRSNKPSLIRNARGGWRMNRILWNLFFTKLQSRAFAPSILRRSSFHGSRLVSWWRGKSAAISETVGFSLTGSRWTNCDRIFPELITFVRENEIKADWHCGCF